jgi:hypothetical protein
MQPVARLRHLGVEGGKLGRDEIGNVGYRAAGFRFGFAVTPRFDRAEVFF